jgi:hypothetical protein
LASFFNLCVTTLHWCFELTDLLATFERCFASLHKLFTVAHGDYPYS